MHKSINFKKLQVAALIFLSFAVSINILTVDIKLFIISLIQILIPFLFISYLVAKKSIAIHWSLYLYLGYLAFYFSSAVFSGKLIVGFSDFINGPILILLLFMVFSMYFQTETMAELLLWYFLCSSILVVFSFGIEFQIFDFPRYLHNFSSLEPGAIERDYSRFTGIYINPNALGVFLAFYVLLILYFLSSRPKMLYLGVLILLFLIIFSGLLYTASRAAILTGVLYMFSYILLSKGIEKKMLLFFLACFVGFIIYFVSDLSFVIDRFKSDGLTGRDEIWGYTLDVVGDNLFFGIGPGSYLYSDSGGATFSAHNIFLSLLVNVGLFATIFFVTFLGAVIALGWRLVYSRGVDSPEVRFSLVYLIGLIFHQMFETGGFEVFKFQGLIFVITASHILSYYRGIKIKM